MTGARYRWLGCAGVLALAGCAQVPVEPEVAPAPYAPVAPAPPRDALREDAIARQAALARKAADAGDLATAAAHYRVLLLLAPGDAAARARLDQTTEAIRLRVAEHLRNGAAAQRNGDAPRAKEAWLRALALDPSNAEAARGLRDLERQAMARVQGDRAARIRLEDLPRLALRPAPEPAASAANGYDLDQRLEMLRAGDVATGLRELRVYVDANPHDRAGRARIGAAVAERAREADAQGQREAALDLYEQAVALRGEAQPEWTARAKALRKALSEDAYAEGVRAYRTDLAAAIRQFEAALRYDPQNHKAAVRLREAKQAQDKLKRLSQHP